MAGQRRNPWQRIHQGLRPGTLVAHECMVAGFRFRVETMITGIGAVATRVNGKPLGDPVLGCTVRQAYRHHAAVLRRLVPLRQSRLPLPAPT